MEAPILNSRFCDVKSLTAVVNVKVRVWAEVEQWEWNRWVLPEGVNTPMTNSVIMVEEHLLLVL